jgi:hypothetical protein
VKQRNAIGKKSGRLRVVKIIETSGGSVNPITSPIS